MSSEYFVTRQQIESRILFFRNTQVMLDRDLAELYQVETRALNQAVKRNSERFPESFCFQLTAVEFEHWKSQIVMSDSDKIGLRRPPFAFTEQGVAMLSAVLRSDIAIQVSIQIMHTFVEMRKLIVSHSGLFQRMESLERKQVQTDLKFEQVFQALENQHTIPAQGIFLDGQTFDAYELVSQIIKKAQKNIVLIDNYINETTLTHLAKKDAGVKVLLLTAGNNKILELDVQKANEQYGNFSLKQFNRSHDRFIIIDLEDVYHIGASLKDLGKRWFAFTQLDKQTLAPMLKEIQSLLLM